jgi:hypothetical protein
MKRRNFLFAALLTVALPAAVIGVQQLAAPMPRMLALVYEKRSKKIRRLIDTSMDPHDGAIMGSRMYLAADEVMELFPQHQFPVRLPEFVAPYIGRGVIV